MTKTLSEKMQPNTVSLIKYLNNYVKYNPLIIYSKKLKLITKDVSLKSPEFQSGNVLLPSE